MLYTQTIQPRLADFRYSLLNNTRALFSLCSIASIVGDGCLSRLISRFGFRISTHMRTSSARLGLGTTTIGDTQGVGPFPDSTSVASVRNTVVNPNLSVYKRGLKKLNKYNNCNVIESTIRQS